MIANITIHIDPARRSGLAMMASSIILSVGGKGLSKTWMSLPTQPSAHLNLKHRVTWEAWGLSGQIITHLQGFCIFTRLFRQGTPGCFLHPLPPPLIVDCCLKRKNALSPCKKNDMSGFCYINIEIILMNGRASDTEKTSLGSPAKETCKIGSPKGCP